MELGKELKVIWIFPDNSFGAGKDQETHRHHEPELMFIIFEREYP